VVGPTDPQWTETDRSLWRVWANRKAAQCRDCGTWAEEWAGNPTAYVGTARICPGCETLAREHQNDPDPKGTPGRKIGLVVPDVADETAEQQYAETAGIDTLRSVLSRREMESPTR
jgi:hypothetical protein